MNTLEERAELIERQAKLSKGLLIASKAREAKLKRELQASRDVAQGFEARLKTREEEIRQKFSE